MPARPSVPSLGTGLAYQPALRTFMEERSDLFDFIEVVPDILWTDLGPGREERYIDDPAGTAFLAEMRRAKHVIPHSIGLSIGSAHRFDRAHIAQISRWHDWLRFPWHSDHLAYSVAEHGAGDGSTGDAGDVNVGITLPLAYDRETLELLAPRIAEVQSRIPVPFLLENNVYFFQYPGQELDEPGFLNLLCETTGCGLLLDLHNIYANGRNHRFDPFDFLGRLDLDNVMEIHIAGGMEYEGFYLDAHSGTTPPPVWEMLDYVLPRAPNLGGVVFELLGSWYVDVGPERLAAELHRMRELWMKHHAAPEEVA